MGDENKNRECPGCSGLRVRIERLESQLEHRLLLEKATQLSMMRCSRGCGSFATRSATVKHERAGIDTIPQLICDACEPFNQFRLIPGSVTPIFQDTPQAELARRINAYEKQASKPVAAA